MHHPEPGDGSHITLLSLVAQLLAAAGTIAVAILAIWGDWFRAKLAPPKLRIEPHMNLRGTVTNFTDGPRVILYHLKVVNSRIWAPAKNCRVLIRSIHRRALNQQFSLAPLPVPVQLVWAPAELTPAVITLTKEHVIDFARLIEKQDRVEPVLYSFPNDFQGFVRRNEAVRYSLAAIADGYDPNRHQVFEVTWDGTWCDDLDQMAQHLTIREILPEPANRS